MLEGQSYAKANGTVSVSGSSVVGIGTSFTQDFKAGGYFIVNDTIIKIASIEDDLHLTLEGEIEATNQEYQLLTNYA